MNLDNIVPTGVGKKTYPVEEWVAEIRDNGHVVVPIYHSKRSNVGEYKAKAVRNYLAHLIGKIWYIYGHDDNDQLVVVISDKKALFTERGWDAQQDKAVG